MDNISTTEPRGAEEDIEVIFDKPRTLHDLANEQRAFLATHTTPLVDIDLPSVHALPRRDKFRLVQELITELAQEEGITEGEYPIWSPYEAHEAAATLLQLLKENEAKAA